MAMVPTRYADLIVSRTPWRGKQTRQMADGVANGVTSYLVSHPLNVVVSYGDVGAPGSGAGAGVLIPTSCPASALHGLLADNLRSHSINGAQIGELAGGLALATCEYLGSAQTVTAHAGVGTGTGVGQVLGLTQAGMAASIVSASGLVGAQWGLMATAIATAICTFLMTHIQFAIAITGPAGAGSATGTGSGRLY